MRVAGSIARPQNDGRPGHSPDGPRLAGTMTQYAIAFNDFESIGSANIDVQRSGSA